MSGFPRPPSREVRMMILVYTLPAVFNITFPFSAIENLGNARPAPVTPVLFNSNRYFPAVKFFFKFFFIFFSGPPGGASRASPGGRNREGKEGK